jgi:hypothetical protein
MAKGETALPPHTTFSYIIKPFSFGIAGYLALLIAVKKTN